MAEIISVEQKSQIEMNPGGRNNPCGIEKPDRDALDRGKIIPVEQKSKIEMHLIGRNNLCGTEKPGRDADQFKSPKAWKKSS